MKSAKITILSLLIFIIPLINAGCVSTKLTSAKEPGFSSRTFGNIMVVCETKDQSKKQMLEDYITQKFQQCNIPSVQSYKLFSPEGLTDEQKKEVVLKNSIDGLLVINLGEIGVKESYIPFLTSTNTVSQNGQTVTNTSYSGGYSIERPFAEFNIHLYEAETGNIAWSGNSYTGGNGLANFNDVYRNFSDEIVSDLLKKELIKEQKP